MSRIEFRIQDEKKGELTDYCTVHDITISKLLMDYIDILLSKSNAGKAPAKEKNSVRMMPPTAPYHCPWCGKDITHLIPPDRLNHLQNCKNGRKE